MTLVIPNKKVRNYCFTLNNFNQDEIERIKGLKCETLVFQGEIGEENNTPHLQGFIRFTSQRYFNSVKNLIRRWHVEPCRENMSVAIEYCQKRETWDENIRYCKIKGVVKVDMSEGYDSVNNTQNMNVLARQYHVTEEEAKAWGKAHAGSIRASCDLFVWEKMKYEKDYPGTKEVLEERLRLAQLKEAELVLDPDGELSSSEDDFTLFPADQVAEGWRRYTNPEYDSASLECGMDQWLAENEYFKKNCNEGGEYLGETILMFEEDFMNLP